MMGAFSPSLLLLAIFIRSLKLTAATVGFVGLPFGSETVFDFDITLDTDESLVFLESLGLDFDVPFETVLLDLDLLDDFADE